MTKFLIFGIVALLSVKVALAEDEADDSGGGSEGSETKKLVLRFIGGPQIENFKLAGSSGFAASLPQKMGMTYGGEVRYRLGAANYSLRTKVRRSQVTYDGLTLLTPTSIKASRTQLDFIFAGNFLAGIGGGFFETLQLGFGFYYGIRSATITAPNEVVTNTKSTGGVYYFSYSRPIGSTFDYEVDGELIFPFRFSESSQVSGNYQTGLMTEIGVSFGYNITEVLEVSVGGRFRRESITFAGTGTRGTVDARDSSTSFIMPFDVRFNF